MATLEQLRRQLARLPGVVPAALVPPASQGRAEEARIVPAELVEPTPLTARAVGPAEPWPGPVAFLDGIQRYQVVAYVGAAPLLIADVAAAVRERNGRESRTVLAERRRLAIGRPEVLAAASAALEEIDTLALRSEEPAHPLRDLELGRAAIDAARGELERRAGTAYRRHSEHWLIIDGSLAESVAWAEDPRMIGVAKSHATLPFDGEELISYLHLPVGTRSNIFRPASRHVAPVYAWGLRLWEWAGKDLLHGLIRVEAAASDATLGMADRISRWLLAERAPISADARWDRLLYGIHSVEKYLRASGGQR